MIQGQNTPIRVRLGGDIVFENITTLHASLFKGSKELKAWSRADVEFDGNVMRLPVTEKETMAFPSGLVTLYVKALDQKGETIFWKHTSANIVEWLDKTEITND